MKNTHENPYELVDCFTLSVLTNTVIGTVFDIYVNTMMNLL